MRVFLTGGAGFIGRGLIRFLLSETDWSILNFDKLSYAGDREFLKSYDNDESYQFVEGDIRNGRLVKHWLGEFKPDTVLHLASESHVDRSIEGPDDFIKNNILGTYHLLEETVNYWESYSNDKSFKFINVSTDEVYGSIGEGLHSEESCYDPSNPYAASKASADHLVTAWQKTYGLPAIITHCTNNYGPGQYPEKLIPLTILKALEGDEIPLYGDGRQIRDWIFLEDHCRALKKVIKKGKVGAQYNISSNDRVKNLYLVQKICDILDNKVSENAHKPHRDLITFVKDRPGHDRRYALDNSKIQEELDWDSHISLSEGLHRTIDWYVDPPTWFNDLH